MLKQRQIIESGIIKYIHGNHAAVEIIKPDSEKCKSCGVCGGIDHKANLLEVEIIPHMRVGQQVTLQIVEDAPYKGIILLFILPLFSLLIGSLIGQKIQCIYPNSQDVRMVFCGFIFFLLTIISVGIYDKKLRNRKYSHRKIISVDTQNSFE